MTPRGQNNSVFIDISHAELAPYADQWAFLASLTRIGTDQVEKIVTEASVSGGVIGLRLPACVPVVIAQRVFVDKAGLPSPVLNAIKRLAAFQNPEFYKKQGLRLSTALTPRVIACAEDLPRHIALPRGCLEALEALLGSLGSQIELTDRRSVAGSASTASSSRAIIAVPRHRARWRFPVGVSGRFASASTRGGGLDDRGPRRVACRAGIGSCVGVRRHHRREP